MPSKNMETREIKLNQLQTDLEELKKDIEFGLYTGFEGLESFIEESMRIQRKIGETLSESKQSNMMYFISSDEAKLEQLEGSSDYPLGGMLEPYDIERDKTL